MGELPKKEAAPPVRTTRGRSSLCVVSKSGEGGRGAAEGGRSAVEGVKPKLGKGGVLGAISRAVEPLAPELLRDDDWEKRTSALQQLPQLLSQAAEEGLFESAVEGLHISVGAQISVRGCIAWCGERWEQGRVW